MHCYGLDSLLLMLALWLSFLIDIDLRCFCSVGWFGCSVAVVGWSVWVVLFRWPLLEVRASKVGRAGKQFAGEASCAGPPVSLV